MTDRDDDESSMPESQLQVRWRCCHMTIRRRRLNDPAFPKPCFTVGPRQKRRYYYLRDIRAYERHLAEGAVAA